MKKLYLILAVLGLIAPNIFVFMESMDSGNIMLWLNPMATINAMFVNNVSSAFIVDLLFVVVVFFVWSFQESKRHNIKGLYLVWVLTMLLGLSATFPYFLYMREKALEANE